MVLTQCSACRSVCFIATIIHILSSCSGNLLYNEAQNLLACTRQYIPEDSELHTRSRENLKSHLLYNVYEDEALGTTDL
jgi:hypothetical protein